jgi:hypothetical protein
MMENFIHQSFLNDVALCDRVIAFYQNNPNKSIGLDNNQVDLMKKDSTDCVLNDDQELMAEYLMNLSWVIGEYKDKFPFCDSNHPWGIVESINVQHYKPHGGYHAWHTERVSDSGLNAARHLVFMTYLNDVEDQGETEFFHQGVKIKPQKGLTVIWPADWTYTHRGVPSPTQDKYIVTGWLSYMEKVQ